ncbi:MAG: phosphopantothenoylcysteine decarboxylase/phosphopantothenate--cysteine ligase [Oleiphilaceae bacterium]|jgi:phosphopantothenoylcysteine decarboxylase/phosphopantothenate--cysteine ligase
MALSLKGTKILLGITGGIAAYKAAELCRELKKNGADVRVVMTKGAIEFITPLTMQALSGNPVHFELLDPAAEAGMGHIELAKWPDLIVIAPATANFIAGYSQGLAGDLLSTLLLASVSKVALIPAMNQAMWLNPLTKKNVSELLSVLNEQLVIWGPQEGEQACGDVGPGRMLEAKEICAKVQGYFGQQNTPLKVKALQTGKLFGKRVIITAGPTREAIDPVRYISNHSSGKMGYALAQACLDQGADVLLVSGPCQLDCPTSVARINVISALDMHKTVMTQLTVGCDIFIAAAAVADYRPEHLADKKIKKSGQDDMNITLCQNPDIVASVALTADKPFTIGFAAETNDLLKYAKGKLQNKSLDMIIANDVSNPDIGFNSEQNEVYVITEDEEIKLDQQSKSDLSEKIVNLIIQRI